MWPFFIYHHVVYTKRVNAPLKNTLRLLHDPPALMHLSPLIVSVVNDPEDAEKYTISDVLVMPFGTQKITYQARITLHDDGMRAESVAGAGTRTVSRYTARAMSEGVTEVEEIVSVNTFFLLLPFIKGVIAKAHTETLDRLAAKLEEA
ncbi:hypothetical protein C8R44DRAFT_884147 [Mycena epipterygia]|nr:hypothetical protein C8R44DRAFT_884147 [Mycena epipterygia]